MPKPKTRTLPNILPYILIIAGVIGFICAFVIMYDKLLILKNPSYQPSCSLNPVISCGSVMSSPQGSAFGFPNPIIGLAAFPVLITIGMAMLAGAKFKRWFWLGLEAGTIFGVVFVHWLFFQSVYRIGALCLYCIVVWIVTITSFWYVTLYNLREKNIRVSAKYNAFVAFLQRHHGDILLVWFLIITGLILHRFWYYWQTLI